MKILTIEELREKYKNVALDQWGNPVKDDYGNEQYVMFNDYGVDFVNRSKTMSLEEALKDVTGHYKSLTLDLATLEQQRSGITEAPWAQYTYEEIIKMYNEGYAVPQNILKEAYYLLNHDPSMNSTEVESSQDGTSEEQVNDDGSVTDAYLAFKKNATRAIDNCNDSNDDVHNSMKDMDSLDAELHRIQKETEDKQLDSLQKMKSAVNDWKKLKAKVDKGESLSDREQSRYKELGKIFENSNKDFEKQLNNDVRTAQVIQTKLIDKNNIAKQNFIIGANALEISDEFHSLELDAGENIPEIAHAFGIQWAFYSPSYIISRLSQLQTNLIKCGQDTQTYSNDTQDKIKDTASILDLNLAASDLNSSKLDNVNKMPEVKTTAQDAEKSKNQEQGATDSTNNTGTTANQPAQNTPTQDTQTTPTATTQNASEVDNNIAQSTSKETANNTQSATPIAENKNTVSTTQKNVGTETNKTATSANNVKEANTGVKRTVINNVANNKTNKTDKNNTATNSTAKGSSTSSSDSTTDSSSKTSSNKSKDSKDKKSTEGMQSSIGGITKGAKGDSKESVAIKKDTDKTRNQLKKEAKTIEMSMQKDEKNIIKMTKQSEQAARQQNEFVMEYEILNAQNEKMVEESSNSAAAPVSQNHNVEQNSKSVMSPFDKSQNNNSQSNNTSKQNSTNNQNTGENEDKITSNGQRIDELSKNFQLKTTIIDRNKQKMSILNNQDKNKIKRFDKVTKIEDKKAKESAKAEAAKQMKLQKELGVVGTAENVFSITMSTGALLKLSIYPPTVAAGEIMFQVGLNGTLACGLAKSTIQVANGNLSAGLISLGQTAITAAMSLTGTGAAAGGVLGAVSNGLTVVSSSADMVNNVRAVEGKQANKTIGSISTIAGVGAALSSSASTISNLGKSGASSVNKAMQVAGVVGSTLTSTSQIMTMVNKDSKTAQLLGIIGGSISTVAALGQLATTKFNKAKDTNESNKQKAEKDKDPKNADKISPQTKEERKAQKDLAKKRNNNLKEGASEQFADIDTDQLPQEMAKAMDSKDSSRLSGLSAEVAKRDYYKNTTKPQQTNEKNAKLLTMAGEVSQVAGSMLQEDKGTTSDNKQIHRFYSISREAQELMRKRNKRVCAIQARGNIR